MNSIFKNFLSFCKPCATAIAVFGFAASAAEPLPFSETFDTAEGFARFSVNNANNDSYTWQYNASEKLAEYNFSPDNAADDWLFSPAFELKAGSSYRLTYKRHKRNYSARERLAVTIGTDVDPASHRQIVEGDDHVAEIHPTEQKVDFTVAADGTYHIGFHCLSPKDLYYVKLDDVMLEEVLDIPVPAPATGFSVTPAAEGALGAHIAFTIPALDESGAPVRDLTQAELYRSDIGQAIKIWTGIAAGESLEFDDTVETPGNYTYSAVVKNKGGKSAETSVSVYVGPDTPRPVTGVTAKENADHSVTVSWNAPEGDTGVNGGYSPASTLLYNIVDGTGREVAAGVAGTSFTDTEIPYTEYQPQQVLAYTVTAVNGTLVSSEVDSDPVIAGTPYQAPAEESFMFATTTYYPWYGENLFTEGGSYWQCVTYGASPRADAHDDDAGLITFRSMAAPMGASERFCSPKFDIGNLKHPTVSFYMNHTSGADTDRIGLEVAVDGDEFVSVGEDIALGAANAGWQLHTFALDLPAGAKTIQLALKGTAAQGHNIHIDIIRVFDDLVDFTVADIEHTARLTPSQDYIISGKLLNCGNRTSQKQVSVTLNNEDADIDVLAFDAPAPGEAVEFSFNITEPVTKAGKDIVYSLLVANDDDENPANDIASFTATCATPPYPAVGALKGNADGKTVTLDWTASEPYKDYPLTTDGFESYEAFAIDGAGPWKFVDMDKAYTGENEDATLPYPHATAKMAYQVYNPEKAGVDLNDSWGKDWASYQGSQYLASMYNADNSANDDWLISPEISADKPVSFMARALTNGYKRETIEIYYSTTGDDIADFRLFASESCPAEWLQYTYWLPADARYFAIRHTTPVAYCFMLDNLECAQLSSEPALVQPESYNIYRDNEFIANVTGTSYTEEAPEADKDYEYAVSAVFPQGESGATGVKVTTGDNSGVSGIGAQTQAWGGAGCIVVDTAAGITCTVCDTAGRTVAAAELTAGRSTIAATAGIYLVRAGDTVFRVIVR